MFKRVGPRFFFELFDFSLKFDRNNDILEATQDNQIEFCLKKAQMLHYHLLLLIVYFLIQMFSKNVRLKWTIKCCELLFFKYIKPICFFFETKFYYSPSIWVLTFLYLKPTIFRIRGTFFRPLLEKLFHEAVY